MNIGERILLLMSGTPGNPGNVLNDSETNIDNALDILLREFPNFGELVSGKRVADFGCGFGYQSIALVKKYGCSVAGIDSNQRILKKAVENAAKHNIPSHKISFSEIVSPDMRNNFDIVISQNSFEHFSSPEKILNEMRSLLCDSGLILITFGPPWLAPYGSHMYFFCKLPWVNIIFSEKTVMKVRSRFRSDGAKKYEEVESGLNRMTVSKFESIVFSCGMKVIYKKYECIKGINWLSKIPLFRELFINNVTAILSKVKPFLAVH